MMSLKNEFAITGSWLFKHRSYLPLIILPLLFYSLFTPVGTSFNLLLYVGLSVSLLGECIRIITVAFVPAGTSGRNTKQQKATSLNQTGIYSIVRHPLYMLIQQTLNQINNFIKKYGWKVAVGVFFYYLIRDVCLYILLPWFIAKGLIT